MSSQTEKIKRIIRECGDSLNLLIFLGPVLFTVIVALFLLHNSLDNTYRLQIKNMFEILPFFFLLPAGLIAFFRSCIERELFFLWLAGFIAVITLREIHWDWTSVGVYCIFLLLVLTAYVFYDYLMPYIASATFINLFAATLSFYFISEMLLDHNWIRIPDNYRQDISFRSSLEESIEVAGHMILSVSVLLIPGGRTR